MREGAGEGQGGDDHLAPARRARSRVRRSTCSQQARHRLCPPDARRRPHGQRGPVLLRPLEPDRHEQRDGAAQARVGGAGPGALRGPCLHPPGLARLDALRPGASTGPSAVTVRVRRCSSTMECTCCPSTSSTPGGALRSPAGSPEVGTWGSSASRSPKRLQLAAHPLEEAEGEGVVLPPGLGQEVDAQAHTPGWLACAEGLSLRTSRWWCWKQTRSSGSSSSERS
jgi:hypothetical protein